MIVYKNTKDTLLRTNAAISYNNVCRTKHLAAKYAHFKIKDNYPQNVATKKAVIQYRVSQMLNLQTSIV